MVYIRGGVVMTKTIVAYESVESLFGPSLIAVTPPWNTTSTSSDMAGPYYSCLECSLHRDSIFTTHIHACVVLGSGRARFGPVDIS